MRPLILDEPSPLHGEHRGHNRCPIYTALPIDPSDPREYPSSLEKCSTTHEPQPRMGTGMSLSRASFAPLTAPSHPTPNSILEAGNDCWKCRLTPGKRCKKHRLPPAPLYLVPPSPTPYYTSHSGVTPPYSAPPTVGKFETKPPGQVVAPPYVTLHPAGGAQRPTTMPGFSSPKSGTGFHYRQSPAGGVGSPQKQVSFVPHKQ